MLPTAGSSQPSLSRLLSLGCLLLLLVTQIAPAQVSPAKVPQAQIPHAQVSYAQIPRVALSDEEKAFIDEHPLIIVGGETDWPPYDYVENGEYTGAASDYLDLISQATGINFEVITGYTWNELLQMARERKLDVLPMLWFNQERTEFLHFTRPYLNVRHYLYVAESDQVSGSLADMSGKTLAIPKGYAQILFLQKHYPEIGILEVSGSVEAIDSVITGRADGLIENTALIAHYSRQQNITGLKPVTAVDVGVSELHMGVRKDWPLLRDIIQKGLDQISMRQRDAIADRWLGRIEDDKTQVAAFILNEAERRYLDARPEVTICYPPSIPPFSFRDNGQLQGLAGDYVSRFRNELGMRITEVSSETIAESFAKVLSGECDAHIATLVDGDYANRLLVTEPFIDDTVVLATRDSEVFIADLAGLSGQRVGVPKDASFFSNLRDAYPDVELVKLDDIKQGLDAVVGEELFGFAFPMMVLSHAIQHNYQGQLRISGKSDLEFRWGIGVHPQQPILHDILDRYLNGMDTGEHQEIYNRWVSVRYEQAFNLMDYWAYLLLVVVLLVALAYRQYLLSSYNYRLREQVELQTRDLKTAKEAAELANEAKSEFLANISHELRTPMHAILGFANMGQKKTTEAENSKLAHYFNRIDESGNRLLHLLNELLDLAKLEAGRMQYHFVNHDLVELASESLAEMQGMARDKGVTLENGIELTHAVAQIDAQKIQQVLRNLLSNAIKFTEAGKSIRIELVETKIPGIQSNGESGLVAAYRLRVIDQGVGIPENELSVVFDKFVQSSKTSSGSGGTGLGLAICKEIVDGHNGVILASHNPMGGAVFTVKLPSQHA